MFNSLRFIENFVKVNAIVQPICCVIMFFVQLYVYRMCMSIIRVMRSIDLLRTNFSAFVLTLSLLFSFISIGRVIPVSIMLNYIVNRDGYCSDMADKIFHILKEIDHFVSPMDYQIVFIGTVSIIGSIQFNETASHSQTSLGTKRNDSLIN